MTVDHSFLCLWGTPGNAHPGMGQIPVVTPGNLGMVFSKISFSTFVIGPPQAEFFGFSRFQLHFLLCRNRFEKHKFEQFSFQNSSHRHPGTQTREWEWKSQDTREFPPFPGVNPGTRKLWYYWYHSTCIPADHLQNYSPEHNVDGIQITKKFEFWWSAGVECYQ